MARATTTILRGTVAAVLGVLLSQLACDETSEPEVTCKDWLSCYAHCRGDQLTRGDDEAVEAEVLVEICNSECLPLVDDIKDWRLDMYLAVQYPMDHGFFWGMMAYCVDEGE